MPDFLKLFFSLFLWLPSLIGWGKLVLFLFFKKEKTKLSVGEKGLLGIFLITAVGMWLNLAVAIGYWIPFVLWGMGILAVLPDVRGCLKHWPVILICIACIFLTTCNIFFSEFRWDVGFYYLPIIEWISREPVPLGLANLFVWFGHNNSWFTFSAILQLPGFGIIPSLGANAIANLFFLAAVFERAWTQKGALPSSLVFILGIVLVSLVTSEHIGFTHGEAQINDSVLLFGLYSIYLNLRRLESPQDKMTRFLVWAVSVFLITQRVSAFPFVGLAVLTEAYLWYRGKIVLSRIGFMRAILWMGLGIAPFFVRGVMTSGCLFYPFAASCLPETSWSVPHEEVQLAQRYLLNGARHGSQEVGKNSLPLRPISEWIGDWVQRFFIPEVGFPLKIWLIVVCFAFVLTGWFKSSKISWLQPQSRALLWVFFFCAIALVCSLLTAPRVNYYRGLGIAFMALPLVYFLSLLPWQNYISLRKFLVVFGICFAIGQIYSHRFLKGAFADFNTAWPRELTDTFVIRQNRVGQNFYFPSDRDRCFDLPLPCSPNELYDVEFERWGGRYVFIRHWMGKRREWEQSENRPGERAFH